jgi:predicted NUDIX family phosphoesterase
LFNTMVWLQRQSSRGEVKPEEVDRIEKSLLMERWTQLVDLVIVMQVDPLEAIKRENEPRISNIGGSIMNEKSLLSINAALSKAVDRHETVFKMLKTYDTTRSKLKDINIAIADWLLNCLEQFLDPPIMVVDTKIMQDIVPECCFSPADENGVLDAIKKHHYFMKRSEAEESDAVVQVIPCALLMHDDRILLFERDEKDPKAELHGKSTIWQGVHVAVDQGTTFDTLVKDALLKKLRDKLFLNREFAVSLLGYAWDRDPRRRKHMGLFYKLAIDTDGVAADLQKKAFRSGRGHRLNGELLTAAELKEKADELCLEPWSLGALRAGVGGALNA